MSILENVIINIRKELKKQGIKQNVFAERMGYGNVYISNILTMKKKGYDSISFLEKAAKALNVSIESLLVGKGDIDNYLYPKNLDNSYSLFGFERNG